MKNLITLLVLIFLLSCNSELVDTINQTEQKEIQSDTYDIIVDNFDIDTNQQKTSEQKYSLTNTSIAGYTVSPTIVRGGTMDVLTITGSGFGVEPYRVKIGNGAQVGNWQIDIWTDTMIQFRVPSNGRSGNVIVVLPDLTEIVVGSVTVKYGIYNWIGSVGDSYDWFRGSHKADINNEIVWHFELGVSESIKQNFRDALAEWSCKVGINWRLGEDLDITQGNRTDGIWGVFLGNSPGGAHFGASWSDCGNNIWYLNEGEIVFDEATGYKTMLHELGHALQLSHNYNGNSIMSPSGGSEIGSIDIEAAKEVMNWNVTHTLGCENDMIDVGCITYNTYYEDNDMDGFGNPNISTTAESQPAGYVTNNNDCDDTNPDINPVAVEIPGNGIDENCNGMRDDRVKGPKGGGNDGNNGGGKGPKNK